MATKRNVKKTGKATKKTASKRSPRRRTRVEVYDATEQPTPGVADGLAGAAAEFIAENTKPKRRGRRTTAPNSGNQIRRTYKGRELVIDVVDGTFIYEGEEFTSLSALAKSIVGYGISGPHFFRMAMPTPGKLTEGK